MCPIRQKGFSVWQPGMGKLLVRFCLPFQSHFSIKNLFLDGALLLLHIFITLEL
jgi:hypothetical protein